MKKSKQFNKNYKGISANESYLLSLIEESNLTVFGVKETGYLSGWGRDRLHNTLFSLEKKDLITRLKRDCYALKSNENLFKIATEAVKPSYISFWTALSFYGFTEQQLKTIQLVSTKQVGRLSLDSFMIEITTFHPKKFYGYEKIEGFVIAEPEKALIDSLTQPDKCGGLNEFAKCLKNAWKDLNRKRFMDYLIKFNNRSVVSRAGYLIEHLELEEQVERLQKHKSKSFINLGITETTRKVREKEYDKRWNVIINQRIEQEVIR
jgi:predicted transcriptional regulator of viral defense system